jgi:hypothetical protein
VSSSFSRKRSKKRSSASQKTGGTLNIGKADQGGARRKPSEQSIRRTDGIARKMISRLSIFLFPENKAKVRDSAWQKPCWYSSPGEADSGDMWQYKHQRESVFMCYQKLLTF